ncbi:hypothetical protein PSYAE_22383 [Pseudomonas amygdali pv. aesculi str. 0893_23]|uniref:hypothetical protein n=1 Tax=Pseudomonas syringae group genomosp. 2 TaxID=251698 RepID=UPI0001CC4126|nr:MULTISPECIES: hypothetical protein [Pseudomonas syringae group genomosp. 2]EGH04655.1 hypothetical protein PSYAE_22383 [Pseudomonas amygdali pv. aesculi str. 0893_23]KPW26972.1 hypothetical protein ALO90_200147 [Pseudomonas amygdali pv. aesculi]MCQ3013770.1 hypothetical protein [Pseudomonas savastanoi]
MTVNLSEAEMREALFGSSSPAVRNEEVPATRPAPTVSEKPAQPKFSSLRLRVTLRVTKTFEGEEELFSYDANTLSSLVAEQEARAAAKKKRFKYFELVSVVSV